MAVNRLGMHAIAPSGAAPVSVTFSEAAGDPASLRAIVDHFLSDRPASIYSGSDEIHRNIVGERVLGMPRRQ